MILLYKILFRESQFEGSVEIVTKSEKSEVNLYLEENKFLDSVVIYSKKGNMNINRNMFTWAERSSIYLTGSMYQNFTENVFVRNFRSKYAGEGYMEVEKNIDQEMTDYIHVDQLDYDNVFVEKNKLILNYID